MVSELQCRYSSRPGNNVFSEDGRQTVNFVQNCSNLHTGKLNSDFVQMSTQDWNLFLESFEKLDFCIDNGTMGANTFTANTHMGSISGHDMSTMPVSVTPVELDAANIQTISQTAYTSTSRSAVKIMMSAISIHFIIVTLFHQVSCWV